MNTSSFILDSIILILSGNEDMHQSLDEFKFQPDTTTDSRVICPFASEKLMYNVVNTLAPSFLIGSSSFLARLHEVQKSYCSHPGSTRSRYRSRSRHTLLKFSRSLYLDNQLSESIHTWTIGTL